MLTPEQLACAEAISANRSASCQAVAGAGKTTTIIEGLRATPSSRRVLACAFNVSIKKTLESRLAGLSHIEAKTLNGLGHGTLLKKWRRNLRLADSKTYGLLKDEVSNQDDFTPEDFRAVLDAIGAAKHAGLSSRLPGTTGLLDDPDFFLGECESPYQASIAHKVFLADVKTSLSKGEITFDDQLYLPLALNLSPAPYDQIVVDEAQDLNPLQHWLLGRASRQVTAVGDPYQCHPAGTLIWTAKRGEVPIEQLTTSDTVVTYHNNESIFTMHQDGREIEQITSHEYTGQLYTINNSLKLTHNHRILARVSVEARNRYAIYLMQRGQNFRIGLSRLFYSVNGGCFGPAMRARQEKAQHIWLLKIINSELEARVTENVWSVKFNLPQILFESPTDSEKEQEMLDWAWTEIGDNTYEALSCLAAFGQHFDLPIWQRNNNDRIGTRGFIAPICSLPNNGFEIVCRKLHSNRIPIWKELSTTRESWTGTVYGLTVAPNPDGRRLYVADNICVHNSIYGFRGATRSSMDKLIERFNQQILPMNTSFRCPKAVVAEAALIVPHITAAPANPDGEVIRHAEYSLASIPPHATILSRYNAPLFSMAYKFISSGRPVNMLGKDFGKSLLNLIRKQKATSVSDLLSKLQLWLDTEIRQAEALRKPHKAASASDKFFAIEALIAAAQTNDLDKLLSSIEAILSSDSGVTLSSIHHAKGLEWPVVYFLDRDKLPRPGLEAAELEQELNAIYVGITRAQRELHYISGKPQ